MVEFAAAYAAGCASGPIVVGHDGRVSAPVFVPAVLAGVTATGRDALLVGAAATPTLGRLVRDQGAAGGIQISASHNPPKYNGLKFFQPEGMVLSAARGARSSTVSSAASSAGRPGTPWGGSGPSRIPTPRT